MLLNITKNKKNKKEKKTKKEKQTKQIGELARSTFIAYWSSCFVEPGPIVILPLPLWRLTDTHPNRALKVCSIAHTTSSIMSV